MLGHVLHYVRRHDLMRPGDRVGLAVSGGADSVALLRIMLELRAELGVVLSVVHFNHKIRGAEADADQHFVAELAAANGLELHCSSADTPAYAKQHSVSLEAAGRELRYAYFRELLGDDLTCIATAHTMDDQAETVLLRLIRGAGTRGLAGIFPKLAIADPGGRSEQVVRPLLEVRRAELREYLRSIGQPWREDASNLDVKHTRNRLRHELLPIIEREFNPSVVQVLSELADVARAEEDYWKAETAKVGGHRASLDPQMLKQQPLALQRRLVRDFAQQFGRRLQFQHAENILEAVRTVQPLEKKVVELPDGVLTCSYRELAFVPRSQTDKGRDYEYRLPVPGSVRISKLGMLLRVLVVPASEASSGYNRQQLLDSRRLAPELVVRNWRPGDRFWPAHSKSPKKLKELLLRRRIPLPQRAIWPVVVSGATIVWVPGLGPAADYVAGSEDPAVVIEEVNALAEKLMRTTHGNGP